MVFFPLFATGFVLDDYLKDNEYFGADTVILSSASSKTSFSLAFLLSEDRHCKVVGLTSAANRGFVEGMGIYDEVVTYDDIESIDASSVLRLLTWQVTMRSPRESIIILATTAYAVRA